MSLPHKQHGHDAQHEHGPQQFNVFHPEKGAYIQQQIAQRTATKGCQKGHHAHPHGVQPLACTFQNSAQGKGQRGHHFNAQLNVLAELPGVERRHVSSPPRDQRSRNVCALAPVPRKHL